VKINNEKWVHFEVEIKFLNIIWSGNASLYTLLHLRDSSPLQRGIKLGGHKCLTVHHHLVKSPNRIQSQDNTSWLREPITVQVVPVHVTEDYHFWWHFNFPSHRQNNSPNIFILWHADPLLGNGSKTSSYTTAFAK
jgi:hypothetical protein